MAIITPLAIHIQENDKAAGNPNGKPEDVYQGVR
jgi:hypothetical protein